MPVKTRNTITFTPTSLPVTKSFQRCLSRIINKQQHEGGRRITINFRDKSYSAENGGYHPVEVSLSRDVNNHYTILYITDFSYCGGPYPELERDLDFDIGNGMAFSRYGGWQSILQPSVNRLYKLWQSNFVAYVGMDAYDEVKVSHG